MPTTVLYHANCPDGFGAALAYWLVFGDKETDYLPVSYGNSPPELPEASRLIITDFSYSAKELLALWERHKHVIVLDHHRSAEAELRSLCDPVLADLGLTVLFDMEECGATMTWKFLHDTEWRGKRWSELEADLPLFFQYLRDRDLWRWVLPQSREISLALWSLPRDFAVWAGYIDKTADLAREGTSILRYATRLVEEQALRWRPGFLGEHSCLIVNATCLFSEVGDWLCTEFSKQRPGVDFVAYYFDRGDGKRQWGLRGPGKIDLSLVAQAYGGGGHFNAAGFVTEQTFLPVITPA